MIDLNALEKLEKAATPAPWPAYMIYCALRDVPKHEGAWSDDVLREAETAGETMPEGQEDSLLIASTRNALPSLIAELKAARRAVSLMRNLVGIHENDGDMRWRARQMRDALAEYEKAVGG